jgi:homoserine dehydrogenase
MLTDESGDYSAIWRPYHYIGLELAQSIYSIALDKRATGYTKNYNAEVASIAKKDLKKGEKLDGEGGFCARGRLVTSQSSKKDNLLPLGLTDHAIVNKDIAKDQVITTKDVDLNLPEEVTEARNYQYNLI